ncbi:MAG: cytochrome c family protein [Methyloligellaceae bacterium]
MDSFEINKIVGAVLFALLVLFGTRTFSDIIFAAHAPEKPGFEVAVEEQGGAGAGEEKKEAQEVSLAQLLAAANPDKGKSVAKKCTACHSFEKGGPNKIGPNLYGVVGRDIAAVDGFAYSEALKSKEGNWTYEALDHFLANPKGFVPGTKMAFAGVKKAQQRADLILYLRSFSDNPPPLPEAQTAGQ